MPQTFYIEPDEEIISVIGRLRKSSTEEIVFVFPKRALVLQSIINLRLLAREAEKFGKDIVIVSQDEVGKMLAKKAGMKTENYSEDFSQRTSHLELVSEKDDEPVSQSLPESAMSEERGLPTVNAIGTNDFYTGEAKGVVEKQLSPIDVSKTNISLRVRNASPEKLIALNSKRFDHDVPTQIMETKSRIPYTSIPTRPAPISSQSFSEKPRYTPEQGRDERLKNFYTGTMPSNVPSRNREEKPKQVESTVVGKKARRIFFVLGGVSLFLFISVGAFFLLPKAEVRVTPYKMVQTLDKEFNNKTDADENTVSARIVEKEKEVSVTVATTGKSDGVNQKARGTVVIYNNYNTESQPLVATTRLETSDGKLFRLQSGVVVPAMTVVNGQQEAGAIEAQIIADQTGAEYNVDATTFTIPGFKGGPKYDKFTAKSTKAMSGGGSGGASDVMVVAKVDLDGALRDAKEKAKGEFLDEVRGEMTSEEKILDEQIDITPLVAPQLPGAGTVASALEYKGTFKLRAFIFSEKMVKEKIDATSEKNVQGILFRSISSTITYSDSSVDFASGMIKIKAHALVTMESNIDQEKLREALLGKNESGIGQALKNFPEVKNIQVVFSPQWFVQSVPNSLSRVSVVVLPGEDGP